MASFPTCKVTTTIKSPDGLPVQGAIVYAELNQRVSYEGIIISRDIVGYTDGDGNVTLDLWPNVLLVGTYTYYKVVIKWPNNHVETMNIRVVDQPTARLSELIVKNIPANLADDLNSILATLASIQAKTEEAEAKTEILEKQTETNIQQIKDAESTINKNLSTSQDILKQIQAIKVTDDSFTQKVNEVIKNLDTAKSQFKAAMPQITTALTNAQKAEADAKAYTAQANTSKLTAQIAASDASTRAQDADNTLQQIKTIQADVNKVYQQIIASSVKRGRQPIQVSVVRDSFLYTTVDGQTLLRGLDDHNKTLQYKLGCLWVFQNGVFLNEGDDYTADNGKRVRLVNPAKTGEKFNIIIFVKEDESSGDKQIA